MQALGENSWLCFKHASIKLIKVGCPNQTAVLGKVPAKDSRYEKSSDKKSISIFPTKDIDTLFLQAAIYQDKFPRKPLSDYLHDPLL